jgi:hypothetical protein
VLPDEDTPEETIERLKEQIASLRESADTHFCNYHSALLNLRQFETMEHVVQLEDMEMTHDRAGETAQAVQSRH